MTYTKIMGLHSNLNEVVQKSFDDHYWPNLMLFPTLYNGKFVQKLRIFPRNW